MNWPGLNEDDVLRYGCTHQCHADMNDVVSFAVEGCVSCHMEVDLSLLGSQRNRFALTDLISRAANTLFRAPTSH